MLRLGLGFLTDVQSSTEKKNARCNTRPPAALRLKGFYLQTLVCHSYIG